MGVVGFDIHVAPLGLNAPSPYHVSRPAFYPENP